MQEASLVSFSCREGEIPKVRGPEPVVPTRSREKDSLDFMQGRLEHVAGRLCSDRMFYCSAVRRQLTVDGDVPSQCVFNRVLFTKCSLMSVATEISVQVSGKLSNEPRSVAVPVTRTLVTDYNVYCEEGSRDILFGDVALSLDQGLRHYLFKVAMFSVRAVRRFPSSPLTLPLCRGFSG